MKGNARSKSFLSFMTLSSPMVGWSPVGRETRRGVSGFGGALLSTMCAASFSAWPGSWFSCVPVHQRISLIMSRRSILALPDATS